MGQVAPHNSSLLGLHHAKHRVFRQTKGGAMNPMIQEISTTKTVLLDLELQTEVLLFAAGVNDTKPADSLVQMAANIARQAIALLTDPEIAFDDEDGSLNFDLGLNNGHTMFIELYPDGTSYMGVYDERGEGDSETILFMSGATEEQITELFSEE